MTAQRPTVEALAELIEPHITEQTNESGCPLACGYDGDDMAEHIAQRIINSDLWRERPLDIKPGDKIAGFGFEELLAIRADLHKHARADLFRETANAVHERDEARATVARVRALADEAEARGIAKKIGFVQTTALRAALDQTTTKESP